MKRILCLLLVLSVLVLCGCGAAVEPVQPDPTEMPTQASAAEPSEVTDPTVSEKTVYTVSVFDENDSPVAGVSVGIAEFVAITNESGVASFELKPGEYTAQILEVPYGYTLWNEQTDFPFEDGATYVTVYLLIDDMEGENVDLVDEAPEDVPAEEFDPEE